MAEPILTVEHLIKAYGETPVLDDISYAVKPGEVIVVVGPSGCGKSTLLRCLNGLEPTQSGRVRLGNETVAYGGKNLTQLRQRIGMVFQSYELFPHMTVLDNVLLAPTKVQKRPKAEVQQEAEALLDRVGLLAKKNSYPRELSGGQKQRVAIVRALCMHPEILLFDEVTAALDPEMVREVLDVLDAHAGHLGGVLQRPRLNRFPHQLHRIGVELLFGNIDRQDPHHQRQHQHGADYQYAYIDISLTGVPFSQFLHRHPSLK